MKITKYAQSTFSVDFGEKKILIDPGKYNFLDGKVNRDFFNDEGIDILLITHEHGDHFEPDIVQRIYNHSKPKIVAQEIVHNILHEMDIPSVCMKKGDKKSIEGITLEATYATHKVDTIGFIINDGIRSIYHPGDTLYFEGDKPKADILLVPIGGRGNVMEPKEAAIFTMEVSPKVVIPMHYDGPKEYIKPESFLEEMKGSNISVKILQFKQEFIYD
jgi:L-ascorbate metabolism protein UlaG (beta-lactamase superfamily)